MTVSNWRPLSAGSLKGSFDLELPSGMVISGMKLFDGRNGPFPSFPERPYQSNGEMKYAKVITIPDRAISDKFNSFVLAALQQAGHI